jgi:threonine synthase
MVPAVESCLTSLEGSRTRARYDADVLQGLDPLDGAPLLARYDLERAARTLSPRSLAERTGPGMWRWSELLPVRDRRHVVHLGEGATPLLAARRLGPALGVDRLLVKAEGLNPTGSFKARGMSAAVSRARELGVRGLVAPSAGNAGGALAAYGAAAGLPVTVVVPADAPEVNVVEAQACGARVVQVEGVISDCGRVARAIAERTGAFDVSTLKEPYRVEGKKTMGLELVEQLGWAVPDVVVYPTGGGTGLVGMWKAFDELEALGLLGSGRPRMVVAQAEGCAPMVRAFAEGADTAAPWDDPRTRAAGLRVPSAVGDRLILEAVRQSGGTAVAVPEDELDAVQRLAGRRGAGYVSPESAVAFAALAALADDGWLAATERVVVFDCGAGHKSPPPPLPRPPVVPVDVADDPEAIDRLLRQLHGEGGDPTAPRSAPRSRPAPAAPAEPAAPASGASVAEVLARRRAQREAEQRSAVADRAPTPLRLAAPPPRAIVVPPLPQPPRR